LLSYFKDLKEEEWTPSVWGSSKRVDFYIESEKTFIEVKYMKNSITQSVFIDELKIDIESYNKHLDFKNFIIFVYDASKLISNKESFNDIVWDRIIFWRNFKTYLVIWE
jgi:hypothetical protein